MPMLYPMREDVDQAEGFDAFESDASDRWVIELVADVTCILGPFDARTAWDTADAIDDTGVNVAMLLRPLYELQSPDRLAEIVRQARNEGGGLEPAPAEEALAFLIDKRDDLANA